MGNPNIPLWKFVFDIIQTSFTVGISIYVWILAKHKANASRIAALETLFKTAFQAAFSFDIETETQGLVQYLVSQKAISFNNQTVVYKRKH